MDNSKTIDRRGFLGGPPDPLLRDKEGERDTVCMCIYIYIYVHTHMCIYIYI